jgi:hypothetical protein
MVLLNGVTVTQKVTQKESVVATLAVSFWEGMVSSYAKAMFDLN